MPNTNQTKREIAQKRDRVAYLKEFILDNQLPAFHNVEAGFFASAADKFTQMAANCSEISQLETDLQQLAFELERMEQEQTELTLSPVS